MREHSYLGLGLHGFHRVAYTEWGDPANPKVLICVHGLTRNSRDFDFLAQAMAREYRVVCPDVAGRGKSDWLTHKQDYGYPQYMADMNALIARLGVESVDWVGTSMGGLIGMMLAAMPNNPIRRLVINDVGPFVPKAALERLASYVGKAPAFKTVEEVDAYLREVAAPFGRLTDAQWRHLAVHSACPDGQGGYRLCYDPAIANAFGNGPIKDVEMWPVWQAVRCPVLLVRGAESDLLLAETARQMLQSGPPTELVEVPGVGHAPTLMDEEQIAPVREFLLRP